MRIIDEKGRLFGKINVIDLSVIVFLIFFLPVFYFGYRLSRSYQNNDGVIKQPKKFSEAEIPCNFIKVTPEVLKLISVGDKEIDSNGETIGEITWVGEPRPYKYKIDLGTGQNQILTDNILKELPINIKVKVEVKGPNLLYKDTQININSPFDFKTDRYTATVMAFNKLILNSDSQTQPKKFSEAEIPCNFIKVTPEVLKLISVGDKEIDSNGETIGEITWVGEPRPYKYTIDIGDVGKQIIKDEILKELPVNIKIKAEIKNDNLYYKHLFINNELVFKTDRYTVEGLLVEENKEKWVKVKVRFSGMSPELSRMIKSGHIENDGLGRIIGKMSAIMSNTPQEIKLIDPQEKRFIFLSDPYMNEVVALLELLCIEKEGDLYFKNYPIKIGSQISFSSDLYVISGTIVGINSK